jgi:hypothetical protein
MTVIARKSHTNPSANSTHQEHTEQGRLSRLEQAKREDDARRILWRYFPF